MRALIALAVLIPALVFAQPVPSAVNVSGLSNMPLTAPSYTATAASGSVSFRLKAGGLLCYSSDVSCSATAGAVIRYDGTDMIFNVPSSKGFRWKVNGTNELILSSAGALTATGAIAGSNLSGTNTGDVTIGTANGLSIAGQGLSLAAADGSTAGALTAAAQAVGGVKTYAAIPVFSAGITITDTGPITLGGGSSITDSSGTITITTGAAAAVNGMVVNSTNNLDSNHNLFKVTEQGSDVFQVKGDDATYMQEAHVTGGRIFGTYGLQLDTSGAPFYTCDSAHRGEVWNDTSGTADVVKTCYQKGSSTYAYQTISGLRNTATINYASIAAGSCIDNTITVAGCATAGECSYGLPSTIEANLNASCFVSATDTVTIRLCNQQLIAAIDPASATFSARCWNP